VDFHENACLSCWAEVANVLDTMKALSASVDDAEVGELIRHQAGIARYTLFQPIDHLHAVTTSKCSIRRPPYCAVPVLLQVVGGKRGSVVLRGSNAQ